MQHFFLAFIYQSEAMNDSGNIRRVTQPAISALPVDTSGGIELAMVPMGTILEVETRNTTYTVIPQPQNQTIIWGHPEYCPDPILISGLGSACTTGHFREGYLCPNWRLSFPRGENRVATSPIVAVRVKRQN